MGWWSESIMGGDTPLDFRGEFEDLFGSDDATHNRWREQDGEPAIPFVKPTAQQSVDFIKNNVQKWGDDAILCQVTGWMVMERAAPMNDELRQLVLAGIDSEVAGGATEWGSPEARIARLMEFRFAVDRYPNEGAEVDMPDSPGLFDMLADHLNKGR